MHFNFIFIRGVHCFQWKKNQHLHTHTHRHRLYTWHIVYMQYINPIWMQLEEQQMNIANNNRNSSQSMINRIDSIYKSIYKMDNNDDQIWIWFYSMIFFSPSFVELMMMVEQLSPSPPPPPPPPSPMMMMFDSLESNQSINNNKWPWKWSLYDELDFFF